MRRYRQQFRYTSPTNWLVLVICVLMIGFVVYLLIGHLTQSDTINAVIETKYVSHWQSCGTPTASGHIQCTQHTTYNVITQQEGFVTSQHNFHIIQIGKRHHFTVTGWPGMGRYISRVLE